MVDTDILINGFKSKDNPNMRWCKVDNIPEGYIPVSKKASKGLIKTGRDDTPELDTITAGDVILCNKVQEEVKEVKKVKKEGDK
jgi:hypothetical protein